MPKLYLSANALVSNYRLLKKKTDGALIPVLKADAYGHGARFVLDILLREGAELFAVACAHEANELLEFIKTSKPSFTKCRILVMGEVENEALLSLLPSPVIFSVHSPAYARRLSHAVAHMNASCLLPELFLLPVHLKIETGMHRLGLRSVGSVRTVLSLPHLCVEGVYSHLAHAADEGRTKEQHRRFLSLLATLPTGLFTHLSASEGLLRYGDLSLCGARAGLALYGVAPSGVLAPLLPVMRLSARVLSVFTARAGTPIGYGSIRTERRRRLAVIDAGYADGIPPTAGNGGRILLHGRACPLFGAVCMDRSTLDVGNAPLREGEEITLFGEKMGDTAAFATAAGVSPYVLLALRSARTKRVLVP